LDRRTKPKLRGASPGSPPGAEAPWRFTLGPCRAEARAVLRWIPAQAETCAVLRWIPARAEASAVLLRKAPWPKPRQLSFGSLHRPKPKQVACGFLRRPKPLQVSWIAVRAGTLAAFPDPGLGRSPCRSPFGVPRPAEALAVHLSGKPVPAEADRCFPAGKSVGRSRYSSRSAPRQNRSSGGSPPKRRVGRSRSVSPGWIPFGAEALPVLLWRFREAEASGSTGLLDEACRPRKC
jgi:hypothetical protein